MILFLLLKYYLRNFKNMNSKQNKVKLEKIISLSLLFFFGNFKISMYLQKQLMF